MGVSLAEPAEHKNILENDLSERNMTRGQSSTHTNTQGSPKILLMEVSKVVVHIQFLVGQIIPETSEQNA